MDNFQSPIYPCDVPLTFDHILEKVFSHLETADVKNARFVCHRWARFGAKELQKRVTICFKKEHSRGFWFEMKMNENIFSDQYQNQSQTLENLSTLINTSLSNQQFPCNSFRFYVGRLFDPSLQTFLDSHGHLIKKLEFCPLNVLTVKTKTKSPNSDCVIASGLRKLLLHQTPNLQHLELHIGVSSGPGPAGPELATQEVVENSEVSESAALPSNLKLNTKLKVLKIWNHLPQEIFDRIIQVVPNLQEMDLENKDLHYLVRPVNRIYLLRNLTFEPNKDNIDLLENFATNSYDIQLREISFHFSMSLYSHPEIWLRVVRVINKILENSSSSLKKVTWRRSRFLPGIIFPVMNNVKEIQVICYSARHHSASSSTSASPGIDQQQDYYYKPQEFGLEKNFPNLEIVRIRVMNRYRYPLSTEDFIENSCASLFSSAPAPSVKYIYIENVSQQESERFQALYGPQLAQVFPNARVCLK